MKELKTLDLGVIDEKRPEIENKLAEAKIETKGIMEKRTDCVAQCASYVYAKFGYTGGPYTADSVQRDIDYVYDHTGSVTGQGVRMSDFNGFMTAWFTGGAVNIPLNYTVEDGTCVTIVVKLGNGELHAVQLLSVHNGQALCQDPQQECTSIYWITQIEQAYMSTGVIEYKYPPSSM